MLRARGFSAPIFARSALTGASQSRSTPKDVADETGMIWASSHRAAHSLQAIRQAGANAPFWNLCFP